MSEQTLSHYLQRVMKHKNLNARDVERNSGKKIDNSYVSKILNGVVTNPSAQAIVALAEGLGVNPHEVFTAACGHAPQTDKPSSPDALVLVDVMQRIVSNPELIEVLQEWDRLLPEDQAKMLHSLRFLNEQNDKERKGKPRKKKR